MIRRFVGALTLALALLSSGCALFLIGAGGAGGYLIRKGEEQGSSGTTKKGTSESQSGSSSKPAGDTKGTTSSSD